MSSLQVIQHSWSIQYQDLYSILEMVRFSFIVCTFPCIESYIQHLQLQVLVFFFVFTGEPHFVTEVPTQVHWHVNPQCPNVRMFSVDTILHTFPIVLTRRIVLINKSFFTQSVYDWPVRSSQTFNSFLSFAVRVTMFVTKWLNRVSQCPYTFLTPSFLATEKTFTWDSASYTYQWTS